MKPVYDFIEKIPATLCENNEEMVKEYFQFILHMLGSSVSDKFTDLVVRKFITILDHLITSKVFHESIYFPYLPTLLEKIRSILCLRCNNEFLTLMVNTSKNTLPIWLYATDHFHSITTRVLEYIRDETQREQENPGSVNEKTFAKQKIIVYQIIEIYEAVLKSAEKSFGINY